VFVLMGLGPFRFSLSSFTYDEIKRRAEARVEEVNIIGARPSLHKSGLAVETIEIKSVFHPMHVAGNYGLSQIAAMRASVGNSYGFIGNRIGVGDILGQWLLFAVEDTHKEIFVDGLGQAVEVGIELKYDGRNRSSGALSALAGLIR
jgi:uncharacterized protein